MFNGLNQFRSLERKVVDGVKSFAFRKAEAAPLKNLAYEGYKGNPSAFEALRLTTPSGIPYVVHPFDKTDRSVVIYSPKVDNKKAPFGIENPVSAEILDDFRTRVIPQYSNIEKILGSESNATKKEYYKKDPKFYKNYTDAFGPNWVAGPVQFGDF